MVKIVNKPVTLAKFLQQPEVKPACEYIAGQIIQKPMPKGKHSTLQGELVSTINGTLKLQNIAWAFPELRCTFGDRSIVPDIAIFVWDRIPSDDDGEISNTFAIAPDWAIEILSPDQSHTRVTKNILHCLKHGTQMGWLLYPHEKTVLVYRPKQEIEVFDDPEALIPVPIFAQEIQITVRELFACLHKKVQ
ncbi:Uma2 family endonuclease [Pseudanabaena sp. FACHB-1998]|uniref:Uma2 family endonuclease n=1 Tax=Pseudanabaena sp. FACHB-1998 TaxID=2692858 RepID=UPI00168003B4|nr:Uma2 family endonuclease [Pseudanabaena sp. FACHB-1998]MBD2176563.1 Uma2 family endonuclease [Pseudanabaena sp. FACHB-1998]